MKNKQTAVPKALQSVDVKALLRSRGIYDKQIQIRELKQAAIPLAKQMLKKPKQKTEPPKQPKHSVFSDEIVLAYWEKQIHIVDTLEKHFEKKVEQFIDKVVKGFLMHLDSEVATNKDYDDTRAKGYFENTESELLVSAQLDFAPLLGQTATLAGQEALKLVGSRDVYIMDQMNSKITRNVAKFTGSMLDTDRDKLIKTLADGLSDGKSIPEIRKQIEDDFVGYSRMQAERITRTEVLRASTEGTLDAYQQSGVVEGKQWLTAGATDECAAYDGQIEYSLKGNFFTPENEFQDGDPPLHPNCKCVLLPVIVGEEPAYTPKQNQAMVDKITDLEAQIDKRTKAFKELKEQHLDDRAYIKALEGYVGGENER